MTVYVDDSNIPAKVRNGSVTHDSTWCHLFADSQDELHSFAQKLGLKRSYFQPGKPRGDGTPSPLWHYDVTAGKRRQAVAMGAREVSWRDSVKIMRAACSLAEPCHDSQCLACYPDEAVPGEKPRRVLVTGSRTWSDEAAVRDGLRPHFAPGAVLVSGACPQGADQIAERVWTEWGGQVERHRADWRQHGKAAGFIRNAEMVRAGADAGVAFVAPCSDHRCTRAEPHGSHGATNCADQAEPAGITVDRHEPRTAEPEVQAEHSHTWEDTGRREKTCWPCDLVAYRERGPDGEWATEYRPTLRAQTSARLRAAGIAPDDPGLAQIASWNAEVQAARPAALRADQQLAGQRQPRQDLRACPDHATDREATP